jgi:hypothetical protein
MKKVFLLFGIAAFSAASAQQNDLFDIQKHLQKKQAEDQKDDVIKLRPPFLKTVGPYSNSYMANRPELTYTLPNGDKVITLGQDNMPCIVPDMSLFKAMPNPGYDGNPYGNNLLSMRQRQPGQIPNGAMPLRMIVSK